MRKKPKVGQIWYCKYNDAYFLVVKVIDNKDETDYDIVQIKWTDTLERDEVAVKTLLTHESFSYITG